MNIKIIVATHKIYRMPNGNIYLPVHVGAEGKNDIGYQKDNEGLNISSKNPFFCELTGLYWAWKNLNCEYLGLAHYRRHFRGKTRSKDKFKEIISTDEVIDLLQKNDILLPIKRNYYIESIQSHYAHTHYEKDLLETRKVIEELYPSYIKAFDEHMKSTSSHMFNMFIMKKSLSDMYCDFLFSILFELEKRIDISQYDPFQARLYGRISEILLDVWIETNGLDYSEIPVIHMEKINWFKKGTSFLKAKFLFKKYSGSF